MTRDDIASANGDLAAFVRSTNTIVSGSIAAGSVVYTVYVSCANDEPITGNSPCTSNEVLPSTAPPPESYVKSYRVP